VLRFLALVLALGAVPTPVNIVRVDLDEYGGASVEGRPGKVAVRFDRDGDGFTCDEFGKLTRWEPYVAFLRSVAEQASANPNADFGFALEGAAAVVGVSAPGYCNMTARTREGRVIVAVLHNRSCYGSAGCVTDTIAYLSDTAKVSALADAIHAATVAATK